MGPNQPGTGKWRFNTGNEYIHTAPTVVNGTVYIGSYEGYLHAIDAISGTEKWQFQFKPEWNWLQSAPIVVNGTILIGCGSGPSDNGGAVLAIDTETQREQWRFETEGDVRTSPAVSQGTVYFGSDDGNLYALDIGLGSQRWCYEAESEIPSAPVVVDNSVYFGEKSGNFYAVDVTTGTRQWHYPLDVGTPPSPATVADRTVFFTGWKTLHAVDTYSGVEKWRFETNTMTDSAPTIADETVYFGNNDGFLYAVDINTGSETWRFSTDDDEVRGSPTIAGETIYINGRSHTDSNTLGDEYSHLYAVDADTGTERWRVRTDAQIRTAPTVVDGILYVADDDGNLYAFNTGEDGSSRGSRVLQRVLGHHEQNDFDGVGESKESGQSTAGKLCSSCGEDFSEHGDVEFCPSCGIKTGTKVYQSCPNCGTDFGDQPDTEFCPECGTDLEGGSDTEIYDP